MRRGKTLGFDDKIRALVLAQLALANRDPKLLAVVFDRLTELMGSALVVAYRDDPAALEQASGVLAETVRGHAVAQMDMLKSMGLFELDAD